MAQIGGVLPSRDEERGEDDDGAILIVDDEPAMRRMLARSLACELPIVEAANADEALARLAARETWALFVFDVKLGRKPHAGLELLREARACTDLSEVPCVLVTGRSDATISHQARLLDARVLNKPFPKDVLRTWLTDARAFLQRPLSKTEKVDAVCRDWSLSPAQSRVLTLLLEGRTQPEIADALRISTETVNDHTKRIREKATLATTREVIEAVERIRRRKRRS